MQENVKTVKEWPVHKNRTEVESFLGYINYHREFIQGVAGMAVPLYAMIGPKTRFFWGEEEQAAFEQLKKAMISPPVLSFPEPDCRFILETDASDTAVGAQLNQIQDGCE